MSGWEYLTDAGDATMARLLHADKEDKSSSNKHFLQPSKKVKKSIYEHTRCQTKADGLQQQKTVLLPLLSANIWKVSSKWNSKQFLEMLPGLMNLHFYCNIWTVGSKSESWTWKHRCNLPNINGPDWSWWCNSLGHSFLAHFGPLITECCLNARDFLGIVADRFMITLYLSSDGCYQQ